MSQHSPHPKGESAPCVTDFMPSLRRFRIALFHLLLYNSLSRVVLTTDSREQEMISIRNIHTLFLI